MKKLFIDIETAPNLVYTWGLWQQNIAPNQIVKPSYTLCWAAAWAGDHETHYHSIHEGEKVMMQAMHELLEEADAVIHYNGVRFDVPKINQSFLQLKMHPPAPYHQIDLFKTVKNRFKFQSNKMSFIAEDLNVGRKLPHQGFPLWTGCMDGDETCWKTMKKYNIQDVRLLPKLYKRLLPWIMDHPNEALYQDSKRPVCTNCGSTSVVAKGMEHLKTLSYQRFKCKKCGTPLRGRSTVLSAEKRKLILTPSKL